MTEIIDPCIKPELPESPDPSAPGSNPVETSNIVIPSAAFPVRQTEPIEQTTVRRSAIIEKYLWFRNYPAFNRLRTPGQVINSPTYQERPQFIDSFRYCTGKNWIFSGPNGNLTFFNSSLNSSFNRAVGFDINIAEASTSGGVEICKIQLKPDLNKFRNILVQTAEEFEQFNDVVSLGLLFAHYIKGTGPFESSGPIISDTISYKYDFCFVAPAAFFSSEVEQSALPLSEQASITAHYLGRPVEEIPDGALEQNKINAYRFYHNSLDPEVKKRVSNDTTQVFFSLEDVNDITQKATSTETLNPIFASETGQSVLNNHVRITLNTNSNIRRDDSLTAGLAFTRLQSQFMNFLISTDFQINSENRFIQVLDQSALGGVVNNRLIENYEPKSYEQGHFPREYNNEGQHYGFMVSQLSQPLSAEVYKKSPIPYDKDVYNFRNETPNAFSELRLWWSNVMKKKGRTYEYILKGATASTEIMAYRIEKLNEEGNVIQNFYFFNRYDDDVLDFIDTQVYYNKTYTYKIYAINAVIGNTYKYLDEFDNPEIDNSGFFSEANPFEFEVANMSVLSFIETPYFEQQVVMIDKPPMFPEVQVVPYFQNPRKVGFRLTPRYGSVVEKPIQIIPEDIPKILNMQKNSVSFGAEEESQRPVHYSSDNPPTEYEVLMIEQEPNSYQDFSEAIRVVKQSNYNSGYIELNLEPNKTYYMIFRASDNAGISNPSFVYTLTLNSHVDGIYVQFDEYDMIPEDLAEPMTFERVLKIDPSPEQMSVDFSEQMEQENFYVSAPPVSELQLGIEESRLWTRDFKFRLISRTTGRAIDLNVKYDYKIIEPPKPFEFSGYIDDIGAYDVSEAGERGEEERDEYIDAIIRMLNDEESTSMTGIQEPDTLITGVSSEEDDSNTLVDEDGITRSRVPNRTEGPRERLEREERERRERERIEGLRREAAAARNIGTVYDYEN